AGPGPQLRRHEVEDGDAVGVRPPGEPPVEPGVVDQHDRVRAVVAEVAVGAEQQADEQSQVGVHPQEPHDGQLAERVQELGAGGPQAAAGVADEPGGGAELAQGADQVRPVQVAARLAGADEQVHGSASLPSRGNGEKTYWTAKTPRPDKKIDLSDSC